MHERGDQGWQFDNWTVALEGTAYAVLSVIWKRMGELTYIDVTAIWLAYLLAGGLIIAGIIMTFLED